MHPLCVSDESYWRCSRSDSAMYGYKHCLLKNIKESMVFLLAHEFRHLWQYEISKRVDWGKGVFCSDSYNKLIVIARSAEKDADNYAYKKLIEYRKKKLGF